MKVDYMKLYDDPNIDKHIAAASEMYDNGNMEKMLGIGLNMPFECANSASRKAMFSSQYQQRVCLENPEFPYLSTGYENLFGHRSSAYVKSDRDWRVFGKIEKFSNSPGHHYFLFIVDKDNNIDVIERVSYKHTTENYGFLYNNSFLDSLEVGSFIENGKTIKKSRSFDSCDNYMSGKNLTVAYIADPYTTEDAIKVSKSAAMALARPEIKEISILINDNDIPLNLYGNSSSLYKIIPDIGEDIEHGVVCGVRTERNDEIFFTQSGERLTRAMINDTTFKCRGRVIDIDVYCNKDISTSTNSMYEGQLDFYDRDHKRFCREVVELLRDIVDNSLYKKSVAVSKMYTECEQIINGAQYFKDNVFSNIIVKLTIYEKEPLTKGDKITSRYGGKGVISLVEDDELMPRLPSGEPVDLVWNQSTCVNRLNVGQLFECSINYIASNIVKRLCVIPGTTDVWCDMICRFYKHLSNEWANEFEMSFESCVNDDEVNFALHDWITEDGLCLYTVLEPISESITFDTLKEMYDDFSFIEPTFLKVAVRGSKGRIRFIDSAKPSIVAKQYIYRMKQNAEEKHSATAMSATNVRCLNSKSKAAKMFIRINSNTPIRFGEMENTILMLMGAEVQIYNLMIYSTSPQARRDAGQLLESYDFNVQLSEDGKSRSAEMLNAIIKCMGWEFVFKKIPIVYKDAFAQVDPNNDGLFRLISDNDKNALFRQIDPNDQCCLILPFVDNLFVRAETVGNLFKYEGI